jgi:hypothetical protein
MKVRKNLLVISIAATLLIAIVYVPPAQAALQPIIIRPYHFYGPAFYYPWPRAYWGPSYVVVPQTGDVKIDTHLKDAAVYVDGGYAGTTGKLKDFSLRPGNHIIEVRDSAGDMLYHNRVQVLLGKTTKIKLVG